ncbi:MAG TPA: pilus assembly protein [Alphaproteobacteria bacterium]|nr:pilus assembly protein TadG [Rhodospirillaceae bacterium]HRJ67343.1 pilus assembly protein [Alphaproteobacteria bacterium]
MITRPLFARKTIKAYIRGDGGVAAIEAGFLFPVMMVALCGMIDIGGALMANLKVTNSSQIVADLLARDRATNDAQIEDAIVAGRLALNPLDTTTYGIDVAGIQYVGTSLEPTVRWRETLNMDENDAILDRSEGLGLQNEGVVAVTVRYTFRPFFSGYITGDIQMEEEAYVRGRKGLFVERE